MAKAKIRVGILFGGRSGEHEISIRSAEAIIAAMDPERYEVIHYRISKEGKWSPKPILPEPGAQSHIDVVFPILHGTFGEDGTIQGLLELADIAYVGAGVLGSSAGMDKDIMKSLFRAAGLPIVRQVTILRHQFEATPKKIYKLVESKLKYPVFVKPANLGSSVGISKAHDRKELGPAIAEAAKFDRKIVIEEGV